MELEVFVPVEPDSLRQVLADPARAARAVPGLQREVGEGAEPLSGRLKARIAGHTITYRGALRITERPGGEFAVEGDATEVRGAGAVKLALTLRVLSAEGGSMLTFAGTATADGRVAELPSSAVDSSVRRLLGRVGEGLGKVAASGAAAASGSGSGSVEPEVVAEPAPEPEPVADPEPVAPSVFDTEIPPSALDAFGEDGPEVVFGEPPVEAAHARRTMIGRSAEEVDHAPPRGRYAPVPAPSALTTQDTLRWAAPAAALVLASAIVVGRVLRRRK
ncbi:SRPBCC domain-containing protein [Streptomyces sp. NBC_01304]|uniref:SRPBCC domain-containing protein n=1 Tax=Streptomyces sp. NBC_01304 TaxID=2903818 RepID=UPI002E0F9CD2|nr:SRPBCC domain-containing protein [Streptomyces sp. NBC_01304]